MVELQNGTHEVDSAILVCIKTFQLNLDFGGATVSCFCDTLTRLIPILVAPFSSASVFKTSVHKWIWICANLFSKAK